MPESCLAMVQQRVDEGAAAVPGRRMHHEAGGLIDDDADRRLRRARRAGCPRLPAADFRAGGSAQSDDVAGAQTCPPVLRLRRSRATCPCRISACIRERESAGSAPRESDRAASASAFEAVRSGTRRMEVTGWTMANRYASLARDDQGNRKTDAVGNMRLSAKLPLRQVLSLRPAASLRALRDADAAGISAEPADVAEEEPLFSRARTARRCST